MADRYVKEEKVVDKSKEEKELELVVTVIKTKQDLDTAHKNFEYAEGSLIDYYSYQIKAYKIKLDYLMKKARNNGISLDMINELYLKKTKREIS